MALRRTYKHPDERSYAAQSALSLGGINMGELSLEDHKVVPEHYRDLVEALATVQPCAFSGEIKNSEIITALGEAGDIWPMFTRAIAVMLLIGCVFFALAARSTRKRIG